MQKLHKLPNLMQVTELREMDENSVGISVHQSILKIIK